MAKRKPSTTPTAAATPEPTGPTVLATLDQVHLAWRMPNGRRDPRADAETIAAALSLFHATDLRELLNHDEIALELLGLGEICAALDTTDVQRETGYAGIVLERALKRLADRVNALPRPDRSSRALGYAIIAGPKPGANA